MSLVDNCFTKYFLLLHRFQDLGDQSSSLLRENSGQFPQKQHGLIVYYLPWGCAKRFYRTVHPRLYKRRTQFLSPWRAHNPTHIQDNYTQEEKKILSLLSRVCWTRYLRKPSFRIAKHFTLKEKRVVVLPSLPTWLRWVIAPEFFCKPLRFQIPFSDTCAAPFDVYW